MQIKPFFTVIIPTLNEEKFLPKLLSDLAKQKNIHFEVVVVDAHSDDATVELCKKPYPFVLSCINATTRNVAFQRNLGAQGAKGDYLVFFDADVRISPSFFTKLYKQVQKQKALVYMPYYATEDAFFQNDAIFSVFNFLIETSQFTTKPFSLGAALFFEKHFFAFLGGFNEKYYLAEDHEIVRRAKKMGVTAKFLSSISVKISMRRFKKENKLDLLRKYFIATIHTIRSEGFDKKLFEYEMGGGQYISTKKEKMSFEKMVKKYFDWTKNHWDNIVSSK